MNQILAEPKLPLSYDNHGVIRVGNTRVTLDTVVAAYETGATAEEIAVQYPTLHVADVYQVIGYYLHHKEEMDRYLQNRKKQSEKIRNEIVSRSNQTGLRDRLLARMKNE